GQELSMGVTSKGIVIKTRDNAQVVAPYDGTVVFSGPFKGYGNLIIISHNADIVSLIAGMKTIDTENGQMLLAGEPVGLMPDNQNAKLYMEIRKNKKPVNPLSWLGQ
ncbi:MAG: peptidoglycan DD-metalloendopeptidase family protein, partial [Alphaproteobacteria bacterium]|nr:peptidoglycan DD-metalloendopeptidase family protein [Alphaproteobacteria bacterium]